NTQKATYKWVKILENWNSEHPNKTNTFNLTNKKDFRCLWEALNRKMKMLKWIEKVSCHNNNLIDKKLYQIFHHNAISIDLSQGLHYSDGSIKFTKYSQKNDQGGVDRNLDAL
ncbi:634_t:CDS:2, partial [Gigaspora margarita]